MIAGRFGSGSAYAGRIVRWDGDSFQADQIGQVDLAVLLDSESKEHFIWSSPELAQWAHSGAEGQPPGLGEATPAPEAEPEDGPDPPTRDAVPLSVRSSAAAGDRRMWVLLAVVAIVFVILAALTLLFVVKAPPGPSPAARSGSEATATPAAK